MAHLVAACTAEPLGVRADSGPGCREVSLMASFAVGCSAVAKNGFSLRQGTSLYLLVKKKGPKLTAQANS